MFRNTNRYSELPGTENGYELDPYKSFFSIVVPTGADKTNLIINPSFETGTSGWSSAAGISQTASYQRRGLYSCQLTCPSNSANAIYTQGFSTVSGTVYYLSMDVLIPAGVIFVLQFLTSGNVVLVQQSYLGTGLWQRVSMPYNETSSTTRRVGIANNSSNRANFYFDGVQVEQDSLTTYIDGDQKGYLPYRNDYFWIGTAHASPSTRIGQSRHGGRIVPLSDYGFRVTGILGLGMSGRINQLQPLSRGGAYYHGATVADRQFALTGMLYGNSLEALQRKRKALIDVLKDDIVSPDQQLRLLYQQFDDDGNPTTSQAEISAIVDGDPLVGKIDNYFAEAMALTFRMLTPYAAREYGSVGQVLNFTQTITNANGTLQRSAAGVWASLNTGSTAGTQAFVQGLDGKIYIATDVAGVYGVYAWDGASLTLLGGAATGGGVLTLEVGPDGTIYAGGSFTLMNGVANTVRIAKWNGSAWSALGSGISTNAVTKLIVNPIDGLLYVFGSFTGAGGVANTAGAARWTGAAWQSFGTGAIGGGGGIVYSAAVDKNGNLYLVGDFATANGLTANGFAVYSVRAGTWSKALLQFGLGASEHPEAVAVAPNGLIWVGGYFTQVTGASGTIASVNLVVYDPNESSLAIVRSFPSGTGPNLLVHALYFDSGGLLWLGGQFSSVAGLASTAAVATFNNSSFAPAEISIGIGAEGVKAFLEARDKRFFVGYTEIASATSIAVNTVVNNGSATAGISLVITGPGVFWRIVNLTTGKTIYFNLTLLAGEVATLTVDTLTSLTFTSSFRGNLLNTILGGSAPTDFGLAPGSNQIMFYMTGTSGASAVTLVWQNTYHSIDGLIPTSLGY